MQRLILINLLSVAYNWERNVHMREKSTNVTTWSQTNIPWSPILFPFCVNVLLAHEMITLMNDDNQEILSRTTTIDNVSHTAFANQHSQL